MLKKNILCIDDVKSNLFILECLLDADDKGLYSVSTALSADAGLKILLKQKIDLILLDVMMPELDGFQAAKIIKSNKKTKDIPILFVTAKKDDETIEMCYKVGGSDYINKPFNPTELLTRISLHLKLKEKDELIEKLMKDIKNVKAS
jgi:CheY-like chemotaxis protein